MQVFIKIGCLTLALFMLLNLSACGKLSAPVPIEGSGYPHSYPRH